jgi:hypothetical protein
MTLLRAHESRCWRSARTYTSVSTIIVRGEADVAIESRQRFESWKEIATYLGRNVRTVQRWERFEGLPVHRHQHAKLGSIYAYRHEIDAWRSQRRRELPKPANPLLPADGAEPGREIPLIARRTAYAALPITLAVVLVAFCGDIGGYQRGDMVRLSRLSGREAPLDVRLIAMPGDRVRLSESGVFVNGVSAGGVSPEAWRTLADQRWEQTVPDGYFMVVSGGTRHWGLVPAQSVDSTR